MTTDRRESANRRKTFFYSFFTGVLKGGDPQFLYLKAVKVFQTALVFLCFIAFKESKNVT